MATRAETRSRSSLIVRKLLARSPFYYLGEGVIWMLMSFVVPKFADMFAQAGGELPGPTQLMLDMSHFATSWKMLVLAAGVARGDGGVGDLDLDLLVDAAAGLPAPGHRPGHARDRRDPRSLIDASTSQMKSPGQAPGLLS